MPISSHENAATVPRVRPVVWLAWIALLFGLGYFITRRIPRYFVFTAESYEEQWPRVSWLFPHIVSGLLASILGPLQFWPKIRRDYLAFHRVAGRLYVMAVLGGAIASFGLSWQMPAKNATYAAGLAGLGLAWIVTTSMAFIAIRRKNLTQHKQWMIRSYVVTFAFVTFRLLDDLLSHRNLVPEHEFYSIIAWACWTVPLLFTEVILQSSEIFRKRPS